jgi:hypothetical protein
VKQEIFTKHATLDKEEWEQVKGHPIEGAMLLTKEFVLRDVVAASPSSTMSGPTARATRRQEKERDAPLRAAHQRRGHLRRDGLPRAHRLPMLPFQAMRVVTDDGAKGMLDWDICQAFVKALSFYPIGSYVKLEGGEVARVVRSQPEIPEKPVIAVIADAQRNVLRSPVEIDLAMTEPTPSFEPIQAPF